MTSPRLSRDDIAELRDAMIDSHLESIHLYSNAETGNAAMLATYPETLSADYDLREMTKEDFDKLSMEVDNSDLFRWWLNRLSAIVRSTSIDPSTIDQWLSNSLSFTLVTSNLNEYANEGMINSATEWLSTFNKYPLVRIMALWQVLCLNIYIARIATETDDQTEQ